MLFKPNALEQIPPLVLHTKFPYEFLSIIFYLRNKPWDNIFSIYEIAPRNLYGYPDRRVAKQ